MSCCESDKSNNCLYQDNNIYGNSNYWSTNGHIEGLCDGTKYTIYDYWFPLAKTVGIINFSTECAVIAYLYYSDGFVIKFEKGVIPPGVAHEFDIVQSLLKVVVECASYEVPFNNVSKCIFDYNVY